MAGASSSITAPNYPAAYSIPLFAVLALLLMLDGCASGSGGAPVVERAPEVKKDSVLRGTRKAPLVKAQREGDWRPRTYTVKKGDTLYGIGLEFGYDYRELAEWNGIENPNSIRIGQVLKLKAPSESEAGVAVEERRGEGKPPLITHPKAIRKTYGEQASAENQTAEPPVKQEVLAARRTAENKPVERKEAAPPSVVDDDDIEWGWPASGKPMALFNDGANKGVDIAGKLGEPVQASAGGKVVYSGSGLRGYGKLIIIKHNKNYLSAYAHNSQLLVKEGEQVAKGQKIAEMGSTDTSQVKLHFEIRRLGKPVDPLKFLPSDRTS